MAIQKIKLKIDTVYQKDPNGVYYFRYQVNGACKTENFQKVPSTRHISCVQLLKCISTLNIPSVGKNLPGTAL